MGQPLKCLFQNDLQKCPVEKYEIPGTHVLLMIIGWVCTGVDVVLVEVTADLTHRRISRICGVSLAEAPQMRHG